MESVSPLLPRLYIHFPHIPMQSVARHLIYIKCIEKQGVQVNKEAMQVHLIVAQYETIGTQIVDGHEPGFS
jgi:hypothetical protein